MPVCKIRATIGCAAAIDPGYSSQKKQDAEASLATVDADY